MDTFRFAAKTPAAALQLLKPMITEQHRGKIGLKQQDQAALA
jgi:hypothetical protein